PSWRRQRWQTAISSATALRAAARSPCLTGSDDTSPRTDGDPRADGVAELRLRPRRAPSDPTGRPASDLGDPRCHRRGGRLAGHRFLREVALHRRLAREIDAALAVDLGHDDHDLVANGHDVLDRGHVVVGQLTDANEAFLAWQDLDERAEAHDPGHLAQVEGTDLDVTGEALDPLDGLARVLARDGGNLDGAVV